jgi:hypothetical protein
LASFGTNTITTTGIITSGNANLGNLVIANFFSGDGGLLSNLTGIAGSSITNGNSNVTVAAGSNVSISVAGTPGVVIVTNTQVNVTGNVSASGNITAGNVSTTLLSVSGNADVGNLLTTNITTGANSTAGTITGNFSLSTGSRLNATYADLAEYYEADQHYEPGTVLQFGGDKEVTIAEDNTARVAGVVSTDPAYVMNTKCEGEHIVALALQGRVPTKVRGTISKGDMLVSDGEGYARPSSAPHMGTVIGKSLEDFAGEGIIEVAVGRL